MSDSRTNLQARLFAAASGDQQAWRDLVDEYAPRVFALLRSHRIDAELAEEITQSAFVTVAAKIGDYVELGKFEPWLFRIAMNRLRDEMRRRRRQAVPTSNEALIGLVGHSNPDPPAEGDLGRLRTALAQLGDADREVIQLRHYGGLSFREIAELLGQPLGTVLARQHRALQKLADLIDAQGPVSETEADSGQEKEQ